MRTRPKFRQPWIGKCVLSLVIAVGFVGTSFAQQFDAPYLALEKRKYAACGLTLDYVALIVRRKFRALRRDF